MNLSISPGLLAGTVTPPASKSMAHRLIIAAALAHGESRITNLSFSKDIEATLRCMEALGCVWQRTAEDAITIQGRCAHLPAQPFPHMDCGESGSTLRFLIPIVLALRGGGSFTGGGRLMERPQQPYFDLFDRIGVAHDLTDGVLTLRGFLTPGTYALPGDVSSQFFTGLLFALSLLDEPSTLISTTPLQSRDYVTMTLQAMEQSGIQAKQVDERTFTVTPGSYQPMTAEVEADWSQAAFWFAALALGNRVDIQGMNAYSAQGDMVVVPHYLRLTQPGDVTIHLEGCPDLLPPLAVMAAFRAGTTEFVGGKRLRIKESDRLATVSAMLTALGIKVEEHPEGLTVHGGTFTGGTVDGANDHRIVMAAAIAATRASGPVTILGAQAVQKSYPAFFEEFQRLGGVVHVL